jgi:hypothetical protein
MEPNIFSTAHRCVQLTHFPPKFAFLQYSTQSTLNIERCLSISVTDEDVQYRIRKYRSPSQESVETERDSMVGISFTHGRLALHGSLRRHHRHFGQSNCRIVDGSACGQPRYFISTLKCCSRHCIFRSGRVHLVEQCCKRCLTRGTTLHLE